MPKVEITSHELLNALKIIVPKKKKKAKKPFPLIVYKEGKGKLAVADAKYDAKGAILKSKGSLPDSFEVDGYMLRSLSEKYPENTPLIFDVSRTKVVIKCGASNITISRLDIGGKKTIKKSLPRTEKPENLPEPIEKRAEFNHTWGFSARVPMPASAVKDKD